MYFIWIDAGTRALAVFAPGLVRTAVVRRRSLVEGPLAFSALAACVFIVVISLVSCDNFARIPVRRSTPLANLWSFLAQAWKGRLQPGISIRPFREHPSSSQGVNDTGSRALFPHRQALYRFEYAFPSRDCRRRGVIKDRTNGVTESQTTKKEDCENHALAGNRRRGRVELCHRC